MLKWIKYKLSDLIRFVLTFTDYEYENIQWERIHKERNKR